MEHKRLYIDIETRPTESAQVIERLKSKIKPPKNYSKPETIEKYLNDPRHLVESVNSTSLSGLHGQIACIGVSGDIGPVTILTGDEKQMLNDLHSIIGSHSTTGTLANMSLIGHNVLGFDMPFLQRRALVHQVEPLFPLDAKVWDLPVVDTMQVFCGLGTQKDLVSLSDLALALGVPEAPSAISGADVAQAWAEGNHHLIYEHCNADVLTTRAVYQHLVRMQPADMHELTLTMAEPSGAAEVAA